MECEILQRVHWQSLGCIYKRRLAIEMFKAKHMLNRLSQHVKTTDSKRKGKLMEVPRKSLELGRDSLLFRGPVVWNCLDKNARKCGEHRYIQKSSQNTDQQSSTREGFIH